MMPRHSLYKYYSEKKWAEALLDGDLRFHSLAYYRVYEDAEILGDYNEGTMLYLQAECLVVNNQTQRETFTLSEWTFES
jgi:hypothetical protein